MHWMLIGQETLQRNLGGRELSVLLGCSGWACLGRILYMYMCKITQQKQDHYIYWERWDRYCDTKAAEEESEVSKARDETYNLILVNKQKRQK